MDQRTDGVGQRLLGAYAAKLCPVRAQNDVLQPGERAPMTAHAQLLAEEGVEHERQVVDRLREAGAIVIDAGADVATRTAATMTAMATGEPVIVGGRLPDDVDGGRVGEPDALVRVGDVPVDGRFRYCPVEIKAHGMLDSTSLEAVVQPLEGLSVPVGQATNGAARRDETARNDALQLAHYHRMLEACGHAPDDLTLAAVIGREQEAVWIDLATFRSTTTPEAPAARGSRSALELYDLEFAHRVAVTRAAENHLRGEPGQLLVPAIRSECHECPWRDHCVPWLEGRSDPSLLPGVSPRKRDALRAAGFATIEMIAERARGDGSVSEDLVLKARARLAGRPLPQPGVDLNVPSADVEIDVDMESFGDGAYLWGATVRCTGPATGLLEDGYRSSVIWEHPLTEEARRDVFLDFWTWLGDAVARCVTAGVDVKVFCWSAGAENRFLRDGARLAGCEDAIDDFIEGRHWHDLLAWFRDTYETGRGNGLKTVADLVGFPWRDEDPGGAASMTWYLEATNDDLSADERDTARRRLLEYNEDDVRATVAIRDALGSPHI